MRARVLNALFVFLTVGVLLGLVTESAALQGPFSAEIQRAINALRAGAYSFTALTVTTLTSTTINTSTIAATAPSTFTLTNLIATPGNAAPGAVQAVTVQNTTASTVGVPAQWSPGYSLLGHGWDVDDAVDRSVACFWALRPISGNTVTSQLQLQCDVSPFNGGGYTSPLVINNSGQLTTTGAVIAGASSSFSLSGRSVIQSTADGKLKFNQNSGATVSVELNMGTAAPTVTSCGSGTVTAHSTNTAGEVTATGATACTVTFGAPAWAFQPFCTVTDETTASALRISAISTTAFTVANLTSGDKFMWTCFGGGT